VKYLKPSKNIEEIVGLLNERGLVIDDEPELINDLKNIGYFRLQGYFYHYYDADYEVLNPGKHRFLSGTNYSKVKKDYIIDKELRNILMYALEEIEVSIKARINNALAPEKGTFWYVKNKQFSNEVYRDHNGFLVKVRLELEESKELFAKHYLDTYDENYPPSWMMIELLSFSGVSILYSHLDDAHRAKIANTYNVKSSELASYLRAFSYLRNLCAHNSRVWNRKMTTLFKKGGLDNWLIEKNNGGYFRNNLYAYIQAIALISKNTEWYDNIKSFVSLQDIERQKKMGFAEGWESIAL